MPAPSQLGLISTVLFLADDILYSRPGDSVTLTHLVQEVGPWVEPQRGKRPSQVGHRLRRQAARSAAAAPAPSCAVPLLSHVLLQQPRAPRRRRRQQPVVRAAHLGTRPQQVGQVLGGVALDAGAGKEGAGASTESGGRFAVGKLAYGGLRIWRDGYGAECGPAGIDAVRREDTGTTLGR